MAKNVTDAKETLKGTTANVAIVDEVSDKQTELEKKLREEFIKYVNKCRVLCKSKYANEHDIDSEVSLMTHHSLNEFDNYRIHRK